VWVAGAADRAVAWKEVVTELVGKDDRHSVVVLYLREDVMAALIRKPAA
jgi:hypothetical protein